MQSRFSPLSLILLTIMYSGCAKSIIDSTVIYPGETGYSWAPARGEQAIKFERYYAESANYRSFEVLIPPQGKSDLVTKTEYLESKLPGKKPLVIVLPIYGSVEYPSMTMAARLTYWSEKADFNVVVIRERGDLFDWEALTKAESEKEFRALLDQSVKRIWQAVNEVQNVIDWASNEQAVDTNRIGIIGFSLGAMVAPIAMGLDGRIGVGAFAMGGGNPQDIFSYAEDGQYTNFRKLRENAMKRFGKTRDEFKNMVGEMLAPVDPNHFVGTIPPSKVLVFDAKFDSFIPQSSRDSFWKALREPLRVTVPHDHKMSFLLMTPLGRNYIDINIAAFLRERL